MRRYGQVATLRRDMIEEYTALHARVWPEVLGMITACNISNYTIFLLGDQLFSYFEYTGSDYDADMLKMAADPITQSWWTHTHPCFQGDSRGIYYLEMEEIFHHP
jgi:L-rhamnose mutarotase